MTAELTDREAQVLALHQEGLHRPQIAERLGVGRETVKTQLAHARAKREGGIGMRRYDNFLRLAAAVCPVCQKPLNPDSLSGPVCQCQMSDAEAQADYERWMREAEATYAASLRREQRGRVGKTRTNHVKGGLGAS